ncbi:MAG TPA: hypothetical protein VFG23_24765 [Polyangia bacterium]|nr:hypothetical protein [Polyangia bacterium]
MTPAELFLFFKRSTNAICCLAVFGTIAVGLASCRNDNEMVLVVDTNLTGVDIDDIVITVSGSQTQTIDVPLTQGSSPTFPLTLGLLPTDGASRLTVSAIGKLQGTTVVQQEAETSFVDGGGKMLRLLLLDSCVGVSCVSDNSAPETCNAGTCTSAVVAAASLASWTGVPPPRPAPAAIDPIQGRTIWSNGWHSCANEAGVLYCWGQNADGEIGDGSLRNANARQPVLGINDPATVGLGQFVTCICDHSGQAWCWGRNVEGELGTGTPSATSTSPVKVPGINDCAQITGGANHTCVLHADGTVSCWGSNASGQLGQPAASVTSTCLESTGTKVPCLGSPALVPGLSGVVEIAAGEQYTCARKSDMSISCWGDNTYGQLGDGTTTGRSTPAPVSSMADTVELAAGRFFACAHHQGGTVSCWGAGPSGQLGNGGTGNATVPVDVVGLSDVALLGLGRDHGCALLNSGVVWCWGGNTYGQLGNGTTTGSLVPVEVVGLTQIGSIAVGSVHSCARSTSGSAFCWGENVVNELGDGTTTNRSLPVTVAGFM